MAHYILEIYQVQVSSYKTSLPKLVSAFDFLENCSLGLTNHLALIIQETTLARCRTYLEVQAIALRAPAVGRASHVVVLAEIIP